MEKSTSQKSFEQYTMNNFESWYESLSPSDQEFILRSYAAQAYFAGVNFGLKEGQRIAELSKENSGK